MSYEAVTWALKQPVGHSPAKFVLVAIAERVREENKAWPSITMLTADTCQNRKTVLANIQRLVSMGYLEDTGERKGDTGRIVVYRLTEPSNDTKTGTIKQSLKVPAIDPEQGPLNSTETGPIKANQIVPISTSNSPNFDSKQSLKVPVIVPKSSTEPVRTGKGTSKEPVKEPTPPASVTVSDLACMGVTEQVAREFLAIRKRKRAPLTELALAGIRREAEGVGWTLDQTLRKCVERGWQGFEGAWVTTGKAAATGATRHGNFAKQDYHAGIGADGSF